MLDMPGFSRSEIQRAFDWFDYRVYEGNRPLHFRLRRVVRRKIGSNALAYQLFLRLLPVWHSIRYIWKS